MRISIRHELRFANSEASFYTVQHLLLTPAETPSQKIIDWTIAMPGFSGAARFPDAFGNTAHLVNQIRAEEDLFISVGGEVETTDTAGVLGRLAADPNVALFKRITPQTRPNGNLVNRLKAQAKAGASRVEILHWLMNRLHEARDTPAEPEEETAEIVAEDHAHVFVAAARGMDIPARFVTGYVYSEEAGAARLHAWAEAWDEALGWIGFDPSADMCPTEAYVRLAAGLDATTTAAIRIVPEMARAGEDVIRVSNAPIASQQQQQQQSGSGQQQGQGA